TFHCDSTVQPPLPRSADRGSCRICRVEAHHLVGPWLAPLDAHNRCTGSEAVPRPYEAVEGQVVCGVHVAHLLVCRERLVPRVSTQPEDNRPLKADGEERMRDDSLRASGVQVTGERI